MIVPFKSGRADGSVLFLHVLHLVLALGDLVLEIFTVVAVEEEYKEDDYCQAGNCQKAADCESVERSGDGLDPQDVHYDSYLRDRINLIHN